MDRRNLVRGLAGSMPADLRSLRGKLMLEAFAEVLGVVEVECPACRATGWLDRRRLEVCPICCGFREVPDRLADWFRKEVQRRLASRRSRRRPVAVSHTETR